MTDRYVNYNVEIDGGCKSCGSVSGKIEPGKGPHAYHLRCEGCGRGGLWLSSAKAAFLVNKARAEAS